MQPITWVLFRMVVSKLFQDVIVDGTAMSFSIKALLADYKKQDGTREVCLRVTIDRRSKPIGLGFHINEEHWNAARQEVAMSHPNYIEFNREIAKAKQKANSIASEYRYNDRLLRLQDFVDQFTNSSNRKNFLQFAKRELELRRSGIDARTAEQNEYALKKLESFQSPILFNELSVELVQRYAAWEKKTYGNVTNTVNKTLTTWKLYLNAAERKGIRFDNPFKHYRMEKAHVHKSSLTTDEFMKMVKHYMQTDHSGQRRTLQCFLFSCLTGLRISDIKVITWNNIHGDYLLFKPYKTRHKNKTISVPLLSNTSILLPDKREHTDLVFDTWSEPYMNRCLKDIADQCGIKKKVTYHMSRHSFATIFLELGGTVEVLQQILGHSEMKTTLVYTHITDARKKQQMQAFDNLLASVREKS